VLIGLLLDYMDGRYCKIHHVGVQKIEGHARFYEWALGVQVLYKFIYSIEVVPATKHLISGMSDIHMCSCQPKAL